MSRLPPGGRVVPCARVRLAQTGRALHWQLLNVLGKRSALADEDNWYANLFWLNRRKCLLFTHADRAPHRRSA